VAEALLLELPNLLPQAEWCRECFQIFVLIMMCITNLQRMDAGLFSPEGKAFLDF
jgi:hypothetical protein